MNALRAADFPAFYQAVHGHRPFPWQTDLVTRVLGDGRWPDVLDVSTGLGKTSVIDVAVFVAAARPELARRRLFFVVDRRLIIDEAYEHAGKIADALRAPEDPLVARVAEALRQPDDDVPLQVMRMRGGVTWSWRWLDRPDRYAVVVGTVDQVGSRLLFRGYGVGEHLRSIDAALVGVDSMIVLDEGHLSEPFRRVVDAIGRLDPGEGPRLLTMSATVPGADGLRVHRISAADEQHTVARRRLHAERRLHLLEPSATKTTAVTVVPSVMAAWAHALAGGPDSGRVVAVVCNTVARARAVFDRIGPGPDRLLLVGRSRPIDREYLLATHYDRIKAGRKRAPGKPLVIVATQTIEVGANISADALLSESAAMSSIVQRLGRLDRLGELPTSPALIVHDPTCTADDPIYGQSRLATWRLLRGLADPLDAKTVPTDALPGGLAASPMALRALLDGLDPDTRAALQPPQPYIPHLGADVLDAWARTSPAPHADPPVAPYLHGIGHGQPDVALVWRSELPVDPEAWGRQLAAVPPVAEEALEIPFAVARRWLAGLSAAEVGDVEGETDDNTGADDPGGGAVLAVRVTGPGTSCERVTADTLRPGDLLVVRAEAGGCDEFGWHPDSTAAVTDLADLARRRGRPLLRLRPTLRDLTGRRHPELLPVLDALLALRTSTGELPSVSAVRSCLKGLPPGGLPLVDNFARLAERLRVTSYEAEQDVVVVLSSRGGGFAGDEGALESSGAGNPVGLDEHHAQVGRRAAIFSANLALPEELHSAVVASAEWHDHGKRDPRFQAMLHQRPLRALGRARLLAKSGMDPADRAAFRRAQAMAGYPGGMRHEALSARITAELLPDADDLTVHLVAAHHGRARPLLPPVEDPASLNLTVTVDGRAADFPTDRTIDLDAPDRFAALNTRLGRWTLAHLEAVVRLADIWCSERAEPEQDTDAHP
ncbi:type I-U CRISPR-associated helicase/endonuclease Cas3 [Actinocorallia sp. API 0066]|uniref:type I-G CRISPR-associated helicase/endonuclease Cas3g n=1 Tax=Actinocorallia sp. API 0066 TaxID=2896846 RepID=UPI001E5136B8|nr:type I-U CRISPR-associated helicase/endonuclease Cas3 [Actinocorallia sp. API 0066]MCD0449405.1 type I-U CRISPR-associated helicase/endonuclease Cas3 [Actinocorallia sp. API 0066]